MDEDLAAVFSAIFPSATNTSSERRPPDKHLYRSFIEEQYKASDAVQKNRKKEPNKKKEEEEANLDAGLKAELQNAVRKYKNNRPKGEPGPKPKPPKRETNQWKNCNILDERLEADNGLSNGTNGDGDASADLMKLISLFFGPQKEEALSPRSQSEYEKRGAIPKRLARHEADRAKSVDPSVGFKSKVKKSDAETSVWGKQASEDDVMRFSEETCSRPFFYIVPENPSPLIVLPRGSYYVVPRAPSSIENNVLFHPERSTQLKKKHAWETKQKSKKGSSGMNNLSKDSPEKMDSHLNIGPEDVNLESAHSVNKISDKECMNAVVSENGTGPIEEMQDDVACALPPDLTLRLSREAAIGERLKSEFPDMPPGVLELSTEKYLDDEPGLEAFIISEHERRAIQAQLERLMDALPEVDVEELHEKCNSFKGDETLEAAYIKRVRRENKIVQRVLELQHIFPDADPNFLRKNVEQLNCNDDRISLLTDELLESGDYPKISDDNSSMEKTRLWNKYIRNFSVKDYLREVQNPRDFEGSSRNNKHDQVLVSRYLQAKYSGVFPEHLERVYSDSQNNLTKTCASLVSHAPERTGSWKIAIQREDYTEEFLREVCYIEHKTEIDEYLEEMWERREVERADAWENNCFLSCPLCSDDELVTSEVVTCPEGHVFCKGCVIQYVTVKMAEGVYKFVCPLEKCETFFTLKVLESLLSETVLLNIVKRQQAEEISIAGVEGLESCPYCEFAYIPNAEDKIFKCQNPVCLVETCRKCRDKSHIPLRCEEIERPVDLEARKRIEETMTQELVRVCPQCRKKIVKTDGCNKMSCFCGAIFCYLCRQPVRGYEHFSPTGCLLYTNNDELHNAAVVQAGMRARDEILRENPNIRFVHDPIQQ